MVDIYKLMFEELESTKPHTIKAPGRDGGYIRIPYVRNPEWYRDLCKQHLRQRNVRKWKRPRTIIRRCDVLSALLRLMEDPHAPGLYCERIRSVAKEYIEDIRTCVQEEVDLTNVPEF